MLVDTNFQWNINLDLRIASDFDLSSNVSILLMYIVLVCEKKNPKMRFDDAGRVWLDHQNVIKQIPILKIKKGTLEKYFLQLYRCGAIDRVCVNENMKTRAYYKPSLLYYWLKDYYQKILDFNNTGDKASIDEMTIEEFRETKKIKILKGRKITIDKAYRNKKGTFLSNVDYHKRQEELKVEAANKRKQNQEYWNCPECGVSNKNRLQRTCWKCGALLSQEIQNFIDEKEQSFADDPPGVQKLADAVFESLPVF